MHRIKVTNIYNVLPHSEEFSMEIKLEHIIMCEYRDAKLEGDRVNNKIMNNLFPQSHYNVEYCEHKIEIEVQEEEREDESY